MSNLRVVVVGCSLVGVAIGVLPSSSLAQVAARGSGDSDLAERIGEEALRERDLATKVLKHPKSGHLRIEASGLYDSNVLRNDLISGLWNGDVLSEELRRSTQDQLKGNNRAGYILDFRAMYSWSDSLLGTSSLKPVISIAHHSVLGLRFADDLYNLTFFGNTAYEGSTASLGNTAFTQFTYQTFGFGFHDRTSGSYLQLQLVNGQRGSSATLRQADLFTATDGRYLQLDFDGSYLRSDTSQGGFGTSSGLGLALSVAVEKAVPRLGAGSAVQLSITDLGFLIWNGGSERLVNNSVINYDGITVQNVFDLDGVVVDQAALQDTLGLNYNRGRYTQLLPTVAQVRLRTARTQHHKMLYPGSYLWEVSIDQRNLPGYVPHVSITRSFLGARKFKPEVNVSYGGFGGLRVGAGAQWLMHRGAIMLRAPNVLGMVSGTASGAGLMVGAEFSL